MMKRNATIDFIKGCAIILMVFCHAATGWQEAASLSGLINLFHIPVFYIAFGWFAGRSITRVADLRDILMRRVKRLWWPFFLLSAIFTLLHNVFLKIGFYSDDPLFLTLGTGPYLHLTQPNSWMQTARGIISAFAMTGCPELLGGFWFLRALFAASAGYAVMEWVFGKSGKRKLLWMSATALLFALAGRYSDGMKFHAPLLNLGVWQALTAFALVHLGRMLREGLEWLEATHGDERLKDHDCYALIISLLILMILRSFGDVSLAANRFPSVTALILTSLAGWLLLSSASAMTERCKWIHSAICLCGKESLAILTFHFVVFRCISAAGVVLADSPTCLIASHPVAFRGILWSFAYTLPGVVIPVVLAIVWRRAWEWGKKKKQ